jgi:ATP synthase protein I
MRKRLMLRHPDHRTMNDKETGHDGGDRDPGQLGSSDKRLDALSARIRAAKERKSQNLAQRQVRSGSIGQAFKIGIEMVAGVVVGGVIGWYLDVLLETKPALLIVFLLMGAVAGVFNSVRTARRMQTSSDSSKDGE